jgi:hypothetical protein
MIGSNAVVADDFTAVDGFKVVADICFETRAAKVICSSGYRGL